MRIRHIIAALLGATVLISTQAAQAGNDDEFLFGDDASLMGGAVTATTRDGSSMWYNPAGLANADRDTIDVSGTAYALSWFRVPRFLELTTGASADAEVSEVLVIPTALTYVSKLRRTHLELGAFVTRSSDLTSRANFYGATLGISYFTDAPGNLTLSARIASRSAQRSGSDTLAEPGSLPRSASPEPLKVTAPRSPISIAASRRAS